MTYSINTRPCDNALKICSRTNRFFFLKPLLGVFLAVFILQGCFKIEPQPEEHDSQSIETLSPSAQLAFYHLILSESLGKGDMETAQTALNALIDIAPNSELYVQQAILFERADQRDKALQLLSEGALKYPDDYNLHIIWAELLDNAGRQNEALNVLDNFSKRYTTLSQEERANHLEEISNIHQFKTYMLLNSRRFNEAEAYLKSIPQNEQTPTLLFYEVILLRNQGREALAKNKLYDLIKNYPNYTDGWITLASDLEKNKDYKGAANLYKKAFETAPIAEIYLRMIAAQIQAGDIQEAQDQVLMSPFSSEIKMQTALLFMDAKEYKAARTILLTLKKDPYATDDVDMYLSMIAYDTGKNVKECLKLLQDISPDAPNRARMIYLKALLHIRDNDYPSALKTAQDLRNEYPGNKEHWAFMAELAIISKNYKLAEGVTRRALEQWPDDVPLMFSLATSLSFQKNNAKAIPLLEDILLLDENNSMALNALAYMLAEEKLELDRALELARKALEKQPDNVGIMDTLAWVQYQMGNYPEAWKSIQKCVSRGVDDPVIWEHYGDIALALGNKAGARTAFTHALELKPDNEAEIAKKLKALK